MVNRVQLGEVAHVRSGYAFSSKAWTGEGYRVVKIANVKSGRLDFTANVSFVSVDDAVASGFILEPGQLVVGMTGDVGQVARVTDADGPIVLNQRVGLVAVNSELVDPDYLFVAIRTEGFRKAAVSLAHGSVQPNISPKLLESIEISLPPLGDQRAIARTLSALDDKIESNHRKMRIMEELGEATLASSLGISRGETPTYCEVLGSILDVLETGKRPRGGAVTSGVVSLGAESIQSAGALKSRRFKYVPADYAKSMTRGRLIDGDVLLYKDGGTPGNFVPHVSAFGFGFPIRDAVINEHVYRVRSIGNVSQGLLYWLLSSKWMMEEMKLRGTGAAIPGLNSSNVRELPIPDLQTPEINSASSTLDSYLSELLRLGAENLALEQLRDVLLPELISGRLRVSQVAE